MSIELPNGKISLTLPEQVGHNAKQISKIFQILDGLNVQDNVVVIDDISHIMTAQELKVVKQAVAFIVYDGHLYIKKGESSGNAYFDIVFSIALSTVITFESSEIEVNLSNGALGITNSSVSTYSATSIDSKLSAKANITYIDSNFAALSGADFTGAITAPSITENMSGYEFQKVTTLTWTPVYAGVVKNGNKLTMVLFGKYTYHTGDPTQVYLARILVPDAVYDKLYPYTIGGTPNILDTKNIPFFYSDNAFVSIPVILIKYGYSMVGFQIKSPGTLTDGTEYFFRIEVTFLLSDNLAS